MSGRKVNYAKVHQGIFVPGLGELGMTLPPSNKTLNLNMSKIEGGLLLTINQSGQVWDIYVPDGNVALAVLAKEDTANPATLKAV